MSYLSLIYPLSMLQSARLSPVISYLSPISPLSMLQSARLSLIYPLSMLQSARLSLLASYLPLIYPPLSAVLALSLLCSTLPLASRLLESFGNACLSPVGARLLSLALVWLDGG